MSPKMSAHANQILQIHKFPVLEWSACLTSRAYWEKIQKISDLYNIRTIFRSISTLQRNSCQIKCYRMQRLCQDAEWFFKISHRHGIHVDGWTRKSPSDSTTLGRLVYSNSYPGLRFNVGLFQGSFHFILEASF